MDQQFLLFVSGPDRAGKDTLAEKLTKRTMAAWIALQKPMHLWDDESKGDERLHKFWLDQWLYDMYGFVGAYRDLVFKRAIVDRFYADERVYSEVFGRRTYDQQTYRLLEDKAAKAGARQLIVLADPREVATRWRDQPFSFDRYAMLCDGFRRFAEQTSLQCKIVTPSEHTLMDSIVEEIAEWLEC